MLEEEGDTLNALDKHSEKIGMGGFIEANIKEELYKNRMKQRKEIQEKRVKERNLEKGLVIVFTGHGKGKTTAAIGMALRTIGHNKKVAIVQFIKGGWESGEFKALKAFNDLLSWHALGEGFTWETQDRNRDKDLALKAWSKALAYLQNEEYKLVILDEINIAIKLGYLPLNDIINGIKKRPPLTHVVLTGRNADKALIENADLCTEMNLLRHPFREQGVKAQEGIEF